MNDAQRLVNEVRDGIADFVADNWPDRKHGLAEIHAGLRAIEINAAMLAALATPASAREVEALTEEAMYALIEEHLGLKRYRNNCVINNGTGRWMDAERYFELIRAALRTALAARKEGL